MTITHDYDDEVWDELRVPDKKRHEKPKTVEDGFEEGCVED